MAPADIEGRYITLGNVKTRKRLLQGAPQELFEVASFWAAVWVIALLAAWTAYQIVTAIDAASERVAFEISVLCLLASAFAMLVMSERYSPLALALLRIRYIAILLLAGIAGYYWHAYHSSISNETLTQRAALRACSTIAACRSLAAEYSDQVYTHPAR
jgi:hypothetical protein